MIHTRAWELLIGSFTAFALRAGPMMPARPLAGTLAAIGLLAILVPVFIFDAATPFPGLHALLPTMGTALVILFAVPGTLVHRLLAWRGAVAIGLLSYSLYLWHQPIFAFARHAINETEFDLPLVEISTSQALALIGLTFVLSAISYRIVEQPFRRTGGTKTAALGRHWYLGAGGALVSLGAIAVVILMSPRSGQIPHQTAYHVAGDWAEDARQHACLLQDEHADEHDESCFAPRPEILLWSDSHAASLAIGLRGQSRTAGLEMTQLTQAGCAPILDLPKLMFRANCNRINDDILAYAADREYDHIVLHAAWLHEHYPLSPDALSDHLAATLRALRQASPGSNVIVVGATPRWPDEPVFARVSVDLDDRIYSADARIFEALNRRIEATTSRHDAVFIDPANPLCAANEMDCLIALRDRTSGDHQYTFHDNDHLSRAGSNLLARHILEELDL